MLVLPVLLAISTEAVPPSAELPASVRDLAAAAWAAGDEAGLNAIIKAARAAWPKAGPQIDDLAAEYATRIEEKRASAARARTDQLATASMFQNWKGEIELGGSWSTGSTDLLALYGAARFEREGFKWQHSLSGRIDFQQSAGKTTADRLNVSWQPGYKFSDGLFTYGLGQFEHDSLLGYQGRYTLSAGIGYTLLATPSAKLSLTGGPAIRHIDYVGAGSSDQAAGRASLAFRWKLSPTLNILQDASVYAEGSETSALSSTAFETSLFRKLKARLSWDVQYEKAQLVSQAPVDTTSRATLVYNF